MKILRPFWVRYLAIIIALCVLAGLSSNPVDAVFPDTITQVEGTLIVVADTTDYTGDLGARTDQIDLTSLASGSARQSDKLDFQVNRAHLWAMYTAIEFDVAPTSGETVDFYIAFSPSATAGTANPGGTSGVDGAYTGTTGDSLDDSLKQLDYIGSLIATSDLATTVEFQQIGIFKTPLRHGTLVLDNNTSQAFEGDANEMGILIIPLETQIQE